MAIKTRVRGFFGIPYVTAIGFAPSTQVYLSLFYADRNKKG